MHLKSDAEFDALLDRFCTFAQEGSAVTFYNANRGNKGVAAKDVATYSTTNREEMIRWMRQMEEAGKTVTITYDPNTGTWNGMAYINIPEPSDPNYDSTATSLVLQFKVDFLTHQLEGYHFDTIRGYRNMADTIPFSMQYCPPGDFGWVKLLYGPTGDTLFAGDIIWMGCGAIEYPAAYDTDFHEVYTMIEVPFPGTERFYLVGNSLDEFAHNHTNSVSDSLCRSLWNSIAYKDVFEPWTNTNAHIGIYLYAPSAGPGDPADRDYILFMERPL